MTNQNGVSIRILKKREIILIPKTYIRLSAGRESMDDTMQALCFHAGANSVFFGEKLLTTPNPDINHDHQLFEKLGMTLEAHSH